MSHDKVRAAARERMARTGEPYAAARRAVVAEHLGEVQPRLRTRATRCGCPARFTTGWLSFEAATPPWPWLWYRHWSRC